MLGRSGTSRVGHLAHLSALRNIGVYLVMNFVALPGAECRQVGDVQHLAVAILGIGPLGRVARDRGRIAARILLVDDQRAAVVRRAGIGGITQLNAVAKGHGIARALGGTHRYYVVRSRVIR